MGQGQRRWSCIESEGEVGMIESALKANSQVTDYRINTNRNKSYELFFVKGKLETVRRTNTCDTEVTVYVAHDGFLGLSQFYVYPSTTEAQLNALIEGAVQKSLLISNQTYSLPENEEGEYTVESNFAEFQPDELAAVISDTVFDANTIENGSLNSVEVFINCRNESVLNSRGIRKSQVRYDAMVEAIPTYNGADQSVELYEQYNFSNLDKNDLYHEISGMMNAVKARYEAIHPDQPISCNVILNKLELTELFQSIAQNLHYRSVYAHSTMFHKGDAIQKAPDGDLINITMSGEARGNIRSTKFDTDGVSLGTIDIVTDGKAINYFGSTRFGQYLGEKPTGELRCLCVKSGSIPEDQFSKGEYLEIVSMSGLQVDFFNDYIGGEVRLAYYSDGKTVTPVTGISISGSVSDVLNHIQLSQKTAIHNGYIGPEKAILSGMKIF